jgi:Mg/Co/Ni transporter MgtE
MSPRAASRLESLGFAKVYDYAAGKLHWWASGLPVEGTEAEPPTIAALAHADVPTCGPEEVLASVAERVRATGWRNCVVLDEQRVVIGELDARHLDDGSSEKVSDAMQEGPRTFRPNVSIEEMKGWFSTRKRIDTVLVTTPEGVLLGLLYFDEL